MKTYLSILIVLFAAAFKAQDYRKDILAVNKTLLGQKSYSLQLHYKMYLDQDLATPYQQRTVKVIRNEENLYMKQNEDVEVIETGRYSVMMDHRSKWYSAGIKEATDDNDRQEAFKLIDSYIDSIVNVCKSIKVVYSDSRTVKYECVIKPDFSEDVSVLWIEIDKQLNFYKSITTKYKEPVKIKERNNTLHYITLKTEYSGLSVHPAISPAVFNALNYLSIKNNTITGPSKKYSTYKKLNSTH